MKLSIVTITKNDPNGFKETQYSVESQTYSGIEWVVVDGNIEPDTGIYDAMNKGLARATGDYIIFMNSGDVFANNTLVEKLSKNNDDFIYGNAIEDNKIKRAKPVRKMKSGMITHHQAMVYKRSVIGNLKFDTDYEIAADYKFTLEFLARAKSTAYINDPVCIYQTGGISHIKAAQGRAEERRIRRALSVFSPLASLRQSVAHYIKRFMPFIYWKVKA